MTTPETELKTSDPRDWPEDFTHRDGIYLCGCRLCGERFTGHKRRVLCKVCHTNELRLERDKLIADLDATRADLAEVRRRTAQRCAEIADECYRDADCRDEAVGCRIIREAIKREFLAEQPPVSPPAQDAGERRHDDLR